MSRQVQGPQAPKPRRCSAQLVRGLLVAAVAAAGPGLAGGCVMYYGVEEYGVPPHDAVETADAADDGDEDAAAEDDAATETPEATYDYGVPDGG